MNDMLQKFYAGHAPRIKVAVTAFIVWLLTWLVAKFGFANGTDWSAQISTFAAFVAGYIMEAIGGKIGTNGMKEIQTLVPQAIPVDGHVGNTVAAVQQVVDAAGGDVIGHLRTATPPAPTT